MKSIFRAALTASAALTLAACLGGDKEDNVIGTFTEPVVKIDRTAGTITTRETYRGCDDDGDPYISTEDWEHRYEIGGGKLYLWSDGDCLASAARGGSNDIVGTWKADPWQLEDIPGAEFTYCDEDEIADEQFATGLYRNMAVREVISETQVASTLSGTFCGAEGYARTMSLGSGTELAVSGENCISAVLTHVDDARTGRVESRHVSGGRLRLTFTAGEAACSIDIPYDESEERDCTLPDPYEAFEDCLDATGFFDNGNVLPKKNTPQARAFRYWGR